MRVFLGLKVVPIGLLIILVTVITALSLLVTAAEFQDVF